MTKLPLKVYYPSLDGLRFIAFLFVFLDSSTKYYSASNLFLQNLALFLHNNGWVGVDLFFVLSGFLITTLLLQERKIYGSFSLKDFWIRRALRLLPLYYLALIIATIINLPHKSDFLTQFNLQAKLYYLILGNWAAVLPHYINIRYFSHLWTIALEMQFYLIWSLFLLKIKTFKSSMIICILVILQATLLRFYLVAQNPSHPGIYTHTFARLDTFMFGAILAFIYFYKPNFIKKAAVFLSVPLSIIILIIFGYFLYFFSSLDVYLLRNQVFGYTVIAVVMSYYLLSALNKNSSFARFLAMEKISYLGKISYGLYVWHILGVDISYNYLKYTFLEPIYPIVGLLFTFLLGFISYRFFETRFLKLKLTFTKVFSRPI